MREVVEWAVTSGSSFFPMHTAQTSRYASVNGLELYHELHGPDEAPMTPVVLLHGGVGGIAMFGPNLPVLAEERRVIAVELQGHGRTADIDRPLRYESMADDVAALVAHLRIPKVDVIGYSLGGGVAVQTAIRHPDIVRRLVVISRQIRSSGFFPEVIAAFEQMGPETGAMMKHSPLAAMYPGVNWATLFAKVGDMERRKYDWSADVARIAAPTLLVYADADSVTPEHMMEFWGLLGGGKHDAGLDGSRRPASRLAILPGTTHYDILGTDAVARIAVPFLDEPIADERQARRA